MPSLHSTAPEAMLRSNGDRQAASRDQPALAEKIAHLGDGSPGAGQDEIGRLDRVSWQFDAKHPCPVEQVPQRGLKGGLVLVLDSLFQRGVQPGQFLDGLVVHLALAFAHDPDNHDASPEVGCSAGNEVCAACWPAPSEPGAASAWLAELGSSFGASTPASSTFIRSSSASTPWPAPSWSSSAWISSCGPLTASVSAPEAISSSIALARAFICSVLSSARWIARPTSLISSEMPVKTSLILVCASAAV